MRVCTITLLLGLLLALAGHALAQEQQPQPTPAAAIIPAAIVQPEPTPTPTAPAPVPAPTPAPVPAATPPAPGPAPPTQTLGAAAPLVPPAAECPQLDKEIMDRFDVFFLLTRLVDTYTLTQAPGAAPTPPLNASYAPLTILAPESSIQFLRSNSIDVRKLAADPLQTVLLAPTLATHFVRGYFPADALPTAPVLTLCGDVCGPVVFAPGGESGATVSLAAPPPGAMTAPQSINITSPNVAQCPGEWVIHGVDGYLQVNVTDPVAAAGPALALSYALGGEWDTYDVAGAPQKSSGGGGGGQ